MLPNMSTSRGSAVRGTATGATGWRRTLPLAALLALLTLVACTRPLPEPLPVLALEPGAVEVPVGASVVFTATLEPDDPGAALMWQAEAGSLAGDGWVVTYTAPDEPGEYALSVSLAERDEVVATATVTVVPLPLHGLSVAPATADLLAGQQVVFTATLEPPDPEAEFSWTITAGSLQGSGAEVTYTAPATPGQYTVTAALAGEPPVFASATVNVHSPPGPLQLAPQGPTSPLAAGTKLHLVAIGGDAYPGVLAWDATGGTVTATGVSAVYTAPAQPGEYVIGVEMVGFPDTRDELTVTVTPSLSESFAIVVVPDTQTMVRWFVSQGRVRGIGEWIVSALEERNIAFVTQVGDVVWNAERPAEWASAAAGFDLLHGLVPYSVSVGDHEFDEEEFKDGDVSGYLTNYGPDRYASMSWYRGSHPDGLSHYQVFEAGGREFLHLSLEWEPVGPASDPDSPLGWAAQVLADNPDLPTIITTHSYLWDLPGEEGHFPDSAREGKLEGEDEDSPITGFTTSGVGIFEALVEPNPQVLMVFNGHFHKSTDHSRRGEYHQVSTNAAGSSVYEMLANYQWIGNSSDVGGDDWIRIVTFVPGEWAGQDRIEVETFSPRRAKAGQPAYKEGEWSRFTFQLNFAERLSGF